MGMAAIMFNGLNHLNKLSIPFRQKAPCEIAQAVLEKTFKYYTILYMYIAQGQEQITPGDKILIVTKTF